MADALYGDGGFYRSAAAPAGHFRTAAHASPMWADAIARLATDVVRGLGEGEATVVDMGAGGGELLAGLARSLPADVRLVGVDVAPRPPGLPDRVQWLPSPPDAITGLALANEWLDVVPVDVVEHTADGLRLVEVDAAGSERLGGPPAADAADWLTRWWPLPDVGGRAEVGLPRDHAWAGLASRITAGLAVAVDYAAAPPRDALGTLSGYRAGRPCRPVPDGRCDLTAHVLFESLVRPGDRLLSQRDALRRLGVDVPTPAYDGDPESYLRRLQARGEAAELRDPAGLGGFTWLVHPVGISVPESLR